MEKKRKGLVKRYFGSLLSSLGKLIWLVVILVVLAGIGRYLSHRDKNDERATKPVNEKPIVQPIVWTEVDQAVAKALVDTRKQTESFASRKIDSWLKGLMLRVEGDFLKWYFNYWTQQLLGLEGLYQYGVNSFFINQPTAAEKLTEEIQQEFSNRVLRPQLAELELERIVRETAEYYVDQLRQLLAAVPSRFKIPQADWDRYLVGIALTTYSTDANRQTTITLKALTLTTAGGTVLLLGKMKFLVGKLSGKVMAKSAGKAAAKIATKTGAKVAAKGGGKFLGPLVGIGVLVWDIWDHNSTKKENLPILRQSIADYFDELHHILLYDSESGIMVIFNDLEQQVYNSLRETGA